MQRRHFLSTAPLLAPALRAAQTPEQPAWTWVKLDDLSPWNGQLGLAVSPAYQEGGGYRLEVRASRPQPGRLALHLHLEREDKQPFTVHGYAVKVQLPFVGIYRLWHYRGGPIEQIANFHTYTRGLASGNDFADTYGANTGMPFVLAADREGVNRFALGMLDQVETTGLRIGTYSLGLSERGEGLNYTFEFVRPHGYTKSCTTLADAAWIDTHAASWFDAIAAYTKWVETEAGLRVLAPPAAAFEPIWNTWYPFGQNIDRKIIEENAALCRKAGITTLCLDAGYNNSLTAGMGNPADIDAFNGHTGDWTADKTKFPDMRAMVDRLHSQGHKVTVWVALFMAGKETQAYARVRHMLIHDRNGKESTHLCPRHPETPRYLAGTFLKLARDYDLDGYWLDFMDGLHGVCHASHEHAAASPGEGYNRCLAAMRDAVLGWKRDFIIETRMRMSNINMKQFANTLETSDMPFDIDLNRSMGTVLRAFSAGSAVKLDPMQWHIRESDENVGKACATVTLLGVPVFGVDFRLLPESHIRVVAAWMRFYRRHQAAFTRGDFAPVGFGGLFPLSRVRAGTKMYVLVSSTATAPVDVAGCREIYIANASDSQRVTLVLDGIEDGNWRTAASNCFFEETRTGTARLRGRRFLVDQDIPPGGVLELRLE